MLIIEITYEKPLEEVDRLLIAHREFLDHYYDAGIFIASGAKNPRTGGIIIAHTTQEKINNILKEDPFFKEGVANYKVIEFTPTKYNEHFEKILKK